MRRLLPVSAGISGSVAAWLTATAALAAALQVSGSPQTPVSATDDPVAILDARIAAGEVTVASHGEHGYLEALLKALDIPVSSQGLVFSRTSLQTDRIGPSAPRALYFNDDVYVGAVRDSPFLEIASIDPDEGAVFYTVNQDAGSRPVFQRETTTCLICHESKVVTGGVPGVIVRSVLTDRLGYMIGSLQEGSTTDRTPFAKRFGGYYVTGTHGAPGHAGNTLSPLLAHEIDRRDAYVRAFTNDEAGNVTDLAEKVHTDRYLTPDSDLVALLVLNHQAQVHNLIVQAHEAGASTPVVDSRLDGAVDRLLNEMLFVREAELPGPIRGTTTYADTFAARGPADSRGRSLRDFDLQRRLFKYPLSFLIYSPAFDALPTPVKDRFYVRLNAVLTGADDDPDFGHLSTDDRVAIGEILAATKPEFARRAKTPPAGAPAAESTSSGTSSSDPTGTDSPRQTG